VPDGPMPVAGGRNGQPGGFGLGGGGAGFIPQGLAGAPGISGGAAKPVTEFAKDLKQKQGGDLGKARGALEEERLTLDSAKGENSAARRMSEVAQEKKQAYDRARELFSKRDKDGVQSGKLGVDLSIQTNNLRNQSRLEAAASRNVANRNVIELGGVWIDEGFDAKMPVLAIKAQSDAYFRLLELQPQLKEVLRLGNHLVWVTPSKTALVIDTTEGKEKLSDEEISKLFIPTK
jgi:Ca-activated chloride channel homolog